MYVSDKTCFCLLCSIPIIGCRYRTRRRWSVLRLNRCFFLSASQTLGSLMGKLRDQGKPTQRRQQFDIIEHVVTMKGRRRKLIERVLPPTNSNPSPTPSPSKKRARTPDNHFTHDLGDDFVSGKRPRHPRKHGKVCDIVVV